MKLTEEERGMIQYCLDGGMNRAAEEHAATVCELGIYIGDRNACHFIDYVSNEEAD